MSISERTHCGLLNGVRHGCVSEECTKTLEERVTQDPIADKFEDDGIS